MKNRKAAQDPSKDSGPKVKNINKETPSDFKKMVGTINDARKRKNQGSNAGTADKADVREDFDPFVLKSVEENFIDGDQWEAEAAAEAVEGNDDQAYELIGSLDHEFE